MPAKRCGDIRDSASFYKTVCGAVHGMNDDKTVSGRPSRSAGYLPTLDGWRAMSIVSVILCHDRLHKMGPFSSRWFYYHGQVGVDVFFAISGLLICTRLLNEERVSGAISLGSFYLRRAFRILPPAMFYLSVLLVLKRICHLGVGVPEIAAALLFVRNYTSFIVPFQSIYPFYTMHFWSLAIEEHFYLLLPALLVCSRKWRVPALFTVAIVIGIHRLTGRTEGTHFHTPMRIDALIIPAMIAVLIQGDVMRERLTRFVRFWPVLALGLFIPITFDLIPRVTGVTIAWVAPLLILGTMLRPQSWFGSFLELPFMRYIGRLSYSLYLWQQLFFTAHYGVGPQLGAFQSWPLCLVMTVGCALISFYFVEQPSNRLGHRLASKVAINRISRCEMELEGESIEVGA